MDQRPAVHLDGFIPKFGNRFTAIDYMAMADRGTILDEVLLVKTIAKAYARKAVQNLK